jgi:competence protein ComEA
MGCGPRSERPHPTPAELEALPGIGPVIAQRILEGRPYRSVEELDRIKGIGKKRLEEIRPLVTAE